MLIVPVILAGGSGSRLWPLSRSAYPKQLMPIISQKTMLQETVLRTESINEVGAPMVICNQEHRFLVEEQLKQINIIDATIILEPLGKNTAPAAAIAALYYQKFLKEDPILLILPADHIIHQSPEFMDAIQIAQKNAAFGKLATFGIKPSKPETGFGYIKTNPTLNTLNAYDVLHFTEKPLKHIAETYLKSGEYYWNSGMFMFKASVYLEELKQHTPFLYYACDTAIKDLVKDLNFYRLKEHSFNLCPNDSIDYAVMEKTNNAVLIPLNTHWSDVGSWSAVWEVQKPNALGNVIFGDVITEGVTNSYIRSESRMIAAVGVHEHIIIETPDVVLVAHKENSQSVKEMVTRLKTLQRSEVELHRYVYRPWGQYETLDKGKNFHVKRITVKPGASLSLQMHQHRSEHWVVVSGLAEVRRGEEVFFIKENESTYIPAGIKHRLKNAGDTMLEIIEVQTGDYLGEDDIVRFEDNYGRVEECQSL